MKKICFYIYLFLWFSITIITIISLLSISIYPYKYISNRYLLSFNSSKSISHHNFHRYSFLILPHFSFF
ncbi:uncharacterized protein ASCRUDRAFT_142668 [Ascoidea rubescens DSM 1968]|uniref:Uncharacterized protein n=1 Tax=Ascoidea rubescens DSM 1968 TaxID=1344418 RepID=A0A1D2VIP7_9ASCO|nr:hypothetical protein ASCRUDRAFT_142668 [Ascoidea rubescens DSM 1968]ODV61498.1 hypothetical protein ASCRUDRAFT_142668 [Ascoidea rubescens DSM 1968]